MIWFLKQVCSSLHRRFDFKKQKSLKYLLTQSWIICVKQLILQKYYNKQCVSEAYQQQQNLYQIVQQKRKQIISCSNRNLCYFQLQANQARYFFKKERFQVKQLINKKIQFKQKEINKTKYYTNSQFYSIEKSSIKDFSLKKLNKEKVLQNQNKCHSKFLLRSRKTQLLMQKPRTLLPLLKARSRS
ncbi:hypothetical protein TTHERM_000310339 (macronuclear) [Tetrahymena thermophila SB210]|uniref:Uncharacterized protein n=1 Tax=Tetrahymena thermophila (strain SB210) TaxID=312017 RepID=W7X1N5_TETTS|nr:hypothetical protein TTHERM_000310339 [Tetrahymena thermophila SB210]EWS73155.1 hypothetical protein TTHERM_000310339 [Tetrahymena thermophila SB210]|eukprot:XP_012654342.1 hypothetical protein TTHERM_000310339 [Tetrahymena thermophila SB210]